MAKTRRQRRKFPRALSLLGLSAAAVAGLYAVGRREQRREASIPDLPAPEPAPIPTPEVELTPRHIPGAGVELAVVEGGPQIAPAGRLPVVLLHGLGGGSGLWLAQLQHLWRQRRAMALDLRGHGASQAPSEDDYSLEALLTDLDQALEELSVESCVLVAHSLGAVIATAYAARHPQRVRGLLLADPSGDQSRLPAADREAFLSAVQADPRGELEMQYRQLLADSTPEVRDAALRALEASRPEALTGTLESAARHSPAADLADYPGPKLSIVSHLNSLPVSLHNLVPDLTARRLPRAGHWLMMDRPGLFNQTLDEFLEQIEGAG